MIDFFHPHVGRNKHRHYILTLFFIIFILFVGSFGFVLLDDLLKGAAKNSSYQAIAELISIGIYSLLTILTLFIAANWIHKRPFRTFITAAPKFRWKLTFLGAGLVSASIIFTFSIAMLFTPENFIFNPVSIRVFLSFFFIAILTIPIFAFVEDIFFRGFLLQWVGKFFKRPLFTIIITGIIFGSAHFANPEMDMNPVVVGLGYLLFGMLYGYTVQITNGIEFVFGVHTANNLLLAFFFSYEENGMGTDLSVWTMEYSNATFLITLFGMNLLWYVALLVIAKKRGSALFE
ncbi:CPBP family glutamic-type intramembrane protease [Saliterribacillus persicus]|uniref:CAAX prenyl protease 2/Lysostaphin resistance protein A-like domain-containing protein n=1 Tax=Saliterribacillus persicus TaxID=930114 RepID=A0A368Y803_9BACI|nr:CPBP family intramembrane glutamic endopeptidase [Saliterribacillus persicus]RCW74957.1 hypothetical protein DFR57_103254 [Saliterribacillus persicus]